MQGLTFVSGAIDEATGKPDSLWQVQESGDWSQDNRHGREIARECVNYMQKNDNPGFLLHVVKAIAAAGRFGGVETGFFHAIAAETL